MGKGKGKGKFEEQCERFFACIACGFFVLCCLAPILTIVGVVYLVKSTTDSRGELTSQYNLAVDAWNSAGRDAFLALSFSAMRAYINGQWKDYSVNGTGRVFFGSDTRDTTWSNDEAKGDDLTTYKAVKYLFQVPHGGTMVEYKCTKGCSTTGIKTLGYTSTRVTKSNTASMEQPSCNSRKGNWINTTRRRRRRRTDSGRRRYSYRRDEGTRKRKAKARRSYSRATTGTLRREDGDTGDCTYQLILESICQRLDQKAGWANPLGDAGGCTYSSGNFVVNSYGSAPETTLGTRLKAILRSTDDPYIKALSLTSGSLNFGRTVEQNRNTGIGCLVAGLVLFMPCVALAFLFQKIQKHRTNYSDSNANMPAVPVTAVNDNPYQTHTDMQMASNLHDPKSPVGPPVVVAPTAPPPPPMVAASPPPLPADWEEAIDANGKTYYYNKTTQETTWDRPGSLAQYMQRQEVTPPAPPPPPQYASPSAPPPLPADWQEAQDSDGKRYYYNTTTNETRWDRPC